MTKSCEITVDANGNKIVQPVFNGGTGSVGGVTGIRR